MQMAADEVLLEQAFATNRAKLRFYTWDPPTLSLGYFQAFADRLPGLPVVRRQTGGGAIIHHHELTYALALPAGPAEKGVNWTCRMHEIIRTALGSFGTAAAASACGRETGRGAFLCFEHQTPGDIVLGDMKVVGMRPTAAPCALLQHGSILLSASPFAPQRRGICDLANTVIAPDRLATEFVNSFSQLTGWRLHSAAWSNEMIARREQLAADRYRHPAWTERR